MEELKKAIETYLKRSEISYYSDEEFREAMTALLFLEKFIGKSVEE